jgi:hypothetical protein
MPPFTERATGQPVLQAVTFPPQSLERQNFQAIIPPQSEKTDPIMHRVTGERAHRKCGWKHSAKDTESLRSATKGAATSALTECAFSWKFACSPVRNRSAQSK